VPSLREKPALKVARASGSICLGLKVALGRFCQLLCYDPDNCSLPVLGQSRENVIFSSTAENIWAAEDN